MITPSLWIARLKAKCPSFGGRVYGIKRLASMHEQVCTLPAAFFLMRAAHQDFKRPTGFALGGDVRMVGTVIILAGATPDDGVDDEGAELLALRAEVRAALVNWDQDGGLNVAIPWRESGYSEEHAPAGTLRWDENFYRDSFDSFEANP